MLFCQIPTPAQHTRLKRKFRLNKTLDYQRVRRNGKSYAHPLIVLIALPNEMAQTRVGVSASRSIGNAVQRNRAKRLLREAIRPLLPLTHPGWDLIFLSRSGIKQATLQEIKAAMVSVLEQANLIMRTYD